jgi:hypothetical protein
MTAALFLAAAFTAWLGCACLALSQERHWKAVTGGAPPRTKSLRITGWLLVAASLALCIARDGGSFAALMWPLLLAGGALATAALLTWRPAWLRPLAWAFGPRTSRKPATVK